MKKVLEAMSTGPVPALLGFYVVLPGVVLAAMGIDHLLKEPTAHERLVKKHGPVLEAARQRRTQDLVANRCVPLRLKPAHAGDGYEQGSPANGLRCPEQVFEIGGQKLAYGFDSFGAEILGTWVPRRDPAPLQVTAGTKVCSKAGVGDYLCPR